MFTQRHAEKALLSTMAALLLLTTAGQSAMTTSGLPNATAAAASNATAAAPSNATAAAASNATAAAPSNATAAAASTPSLTMQLINGSMEEPQVLPSHRSCRSEHETFCENGGECMYPQDSDEPSCICKFSYGGHRCLFRNDRAHTLPEWEQLIGITFGVAMLVIVLAFIIYCLAHKRCIKSAPFKKLPLAELSV